MKRITVLKKRMKKKLTVRTLSFIMAAGLLLIVVPFVAIASGSEKPEPSKRGDFRLLKEFYAVTQVTLEEDMASNPKVSAECSSAESYQWQAYSRGQERYADLPNYVGSDLSISVSFARQYNYGNGESYFRCLATDSDGNLLISDVLTVVLPKPQVKETEETQTEETGATISTIELLEPTQPGETDPTETVESTTAPTEETTAPTEETTAPAEETTAPTTAPTQPTEEDSDPPKGSLVIPDTEEDEDVPLRGMLQVPLRAVKTTYTVNYYIQKPEYTGTDDNASDYVLYKTESFTANVDDAVDLTSNMPGTSFDAYLTQHAMLGNATGTVAADGASVFNVYFIRTTFKFIIARSNSSWVTTAFKLSTKNGEVTVDGSHPYEFYAKFGESLIGLWPTDDMITQPPTGWYSVLQYIREDYSGGNVHHNDPFVYLDDATIRKLRRHTANTATVFDRLSFYFGFYADYGYVANYYLMTPDGNWDLLNPDYSAQSTTNTIFNTHPAYEGFTLDHFDRRGNTRGFYYRRNQYTLTYNANGDTPPPAPEQVYFDKVLTAEKYNKSTTRDGYIFQGWYYDAGFNNPVGWDVDKMPMANITVYAKWRAAVAQHNLTINKNDGTAAETIQVDTGTTLSTLLQLDTPSKTGYTFGGWYTDEDCTVAMPDTMPDNDLAVYAKWTVNSHTLTVHKNNDDDPSTLTATVDYGTTLSTLSQLATPSRTGYTFGGWYTDEDCTVAMPATMPDSNLTVYAKWTINRYVVRFSQVENGSIFATETVDYNSTIPENYGKSYQTMEGYSFKGWRYRDSLGNIHEFVRGVSGTRIVENIDVFGEWNPIYTVTFVPEKDSAEVHATVNVENGETVATADQPANPVKEGYTFDGWWYMNSSTETSFTFGESGTVVSGDMTVYAKWLKNEISIAIVNNSGRDNIYTVSASGVSLKVVVPANSTVTVTHLPFGDYTVASGNWDYRSVYSVSGTPVNASSAPPGHPFTVTGSAVTRSLNWLGDETKKENRFNAVPRN